MNRIRLTRAVIVCALLVGVFAYIAQARRVVVPGYKAMAESAHLVVIAAPTSRVELNEPKTIFGHPAVVINTTFYPVVILKGSLLQGEKEFVLRHLREKGPQKIRENAPSLIDFVLDDRSQYLMFLRRRIDGQYEAVNGQTDPAWCIDKLQNPLRKKDAYSATKGMKADQ